jgi:hypothetical protein
MNAITHRKRAAIALIATATIALTAPLPMTGSATASDTAFVPQLVTVDTPTRAQKNLLQSLGLDLTEHAGHDYVEVVLHSLAEADALRMAGLTYDVRIPDLVRREAEINSINTEYAALTTASPLPSGRDTYRSLADYNADLQRLAQDNPGLVRLFELPHRSLDGRPIYGVEIAENVAAKDGRPTFLLMGLHHAREWPSGELAIEFAIDLVDGYRAGDARRTALAQKGRLVVVPVVNVDGFQLSYEDGQKVDLREVDGGGTGSILGTPGNAYRRKNCRLVDGVDTVDGTCAASATSNGGYGLGVDLNRNYGGLWGGPGASTTSADPTYRGASAFSEPETQSVRELVAGRQVTMMISNHTFSNLVLRPNGVNPATVRPDREVVGNAYDEEGLKALGAQMAAQNGYRNIHGWELYDTTGTTEDWSYNATGGYGYTFEIGPEEFHPPFPQVVDEYVGAGAYAGKGNREAYLLAFEKAVDPANHAVITGKAPDGAMLRLRKTFETPTWNGSFTDSLESSMSVRGNSYTWHVNQSTRPFLLDRLRKVLNETPTESWHFDGTTIEPTGHRDHKFEVTAPDQEVLRVALDWPLPDDLDLEVHRVTGYDAAGQPQLALVASSANAPAEKEETFVPNPVTGTYIARVVNYASATPTYTVDAGAYDATTSSSEPIVESYTLTCEKPSATGSTVLQQVPVVVTRGQRTKVDLGVCSRRWNKVL